jgi:hypothetical protein
MIRRSLSSLPAVFFVLLLILELSGSKQADKALLPLHSVNYPISTVSYDGKKNVDCRGRSCKGGDMTIPSEGWGDSGQEADEKCLALLDRKVQRVIHALQKRGCRVDEPRYSGTASRIVNGRYKSTCTAQVSYGE